LVVKALAANREWWFRIWHLQGCLIHMLRISVLQYTHQIIWNYQIRF